MSQANPATSPASAAGPAARTGGFALPALLVTLVAAALRFVVLRGATPSPTTGEERSLDLLSTLSGPWDIPVNPSLSEAWVTLLALLDRFVGDPAITPANAPSLPADPDPLVAAGRALALLLGAVAAGLAAAAAHRRNGRLAGWVAGGLVALAPTAFPSLARGGTGALHACVAAGALWALGRCDRGTGGGRGLLLGAWVGAALAAGGGGAGLLAGVALVGLTSPFMWGAMVLTGLALAPGALPGFPMLPRGESALGLPVDSPLGSSLARMAAALGPVAMVAAAAGGVRSAVAGPRAERAVAAATGGVLLVALARLGADPEALAGVMPGAAILAAGLAARVRPAAAGPALAAAVAVALLAPPAVGAIRDLGAYAGSSSLEQAEVWIRDRVPDESVLLVEESRLHLPTPEGVAEMEALAAAGTVSPSRRQAYVGNGHTFRTLPLPPSTPNPLERALFYDPNLAKRFAYLVLTELPPVEREVATERTPIELLTARRLFHEYFRESWRQEARFESGRENEPDLIVLGRPEGFEPDLESLGKLGYVLLRDPLLTLREESSAFTDWALEAGRALLAVGDLPAARAYLGMVTERDSTRVEGRLEHARVLTLLGEPARAKREVLLGLSEDPYHGGLHLHMGALLEQEGDFRGAAVEYGAAAAQMADPSIPMAQLGQLLFRMGESEAAHSQLDLLEERHPDAPATRALREFLGSP